MNPKSTEAINRILMDLSILFVGDAGRGLQLQEAARKSGWKIRIETRQGPASDGGVCRPPHLVILDDFPESPVARSAFYRFAQCRGIVFLALNASPHAMKFLHVNALARLKIIDRFPNSKTLIRTIIDLVQAGRKSLARQAGANEIEKPSPGRRPINLDPIKG